MLRLIKNIPVCDLLGGLSSFLSFAVLVVVLTFAITTEAFGMGVSIVSAAGDEQSVHLKLIQGIRPSDRATLGMVFREDPFRRGLVLDYVRPGSLADQAGLRRGDVLYMIDGFQVASIGDYIIAMDRTNPNFQFSFRSEGGGSFSVTFVVR